MLSWENMRILLEKSVNKSLCVQPSEQTTRTGQGWGGKISGTSGSVTKVRRALVSTWVGIFELQKTARGYRCPGCGGDWFCFANIDGKVSGHCWGPKKCGLQGWGHVVGSKIWRLGWEQAAQRFLNLAPEHEIGEEATEPPQVPRKWLTLEEFQAKWGIGA